MSCLLMKMGHHEIISTLLPRFQPKFSFSGDQIDYFPPFKFVAREARIWMTLVLMRRAL